MPHAEWFTQPDSPEGGAGLRFNCTMCGRCCSGPPGFVVVSDAECEAFAAHLGISVNKFKHEYTHMMSEGEGGRSLNEKKTEHGLDCIFLDRTTIPGKAVCGVYDHRPTQCRTWPFWPSLVKSRRDWDAAAKSCPGMNKGTLVPVEQIRIQRDAFEI